METDLTPRLLRQQQDHVSPFDHGARGFDDSWWLDTFVRRRTASLLPYSFVDERDDEVARALLREGAGFADLDGAGVEFPFDAIAVDFLEVRTDLLYPRRGIGTQVVRALEQLHPAITLYAFSEQADEFWRSTGWTFMPRRDGSSAYRPLFALWR
ncbi:hypothetical protein ABC195_06070 [Microbacterium sp. 2P01SA-2]|uniref:hypothetical protein n=1 Tax=unclassified Microbacterium TaxID=2609290 RepID=UPI0039A032B6